MGWGGRYTPHNPQRQGGFTTLSPEHGRTPRLDGGLVVAQPQEDAANKYPEEDGPQPTAAAPATEKTPSLQRNGGNTQSLALPFFDAISLRAARHTHNVCVRELAAGLTHGLADGGGQGQKCPTQRQGGP